VRPGFILSSSELGARAGETPARTFSNLVGLKWFDLRNGYVLERRDAGRIEPQPQL
jgi:hypothetical protein